jgi:hypothetical protein
LSRREHLYRQYFEQKTKVRTLPASLTVSPNNTFLKEVQASYSFVDPTSYGSEITRELLYKNTNFLNYLFIKDFIKVINNSLDRLSINFSLLDNYFVYLLNVNSDHYKSLDKN